MRVTKQKLATKVHNTGVDTFSTSKHSFLNRIKFWKTYHPKSLNSLCEGCCSWKARLDPDVQIRSPTGDKVSEERANRLVTPSTVQERAVHDGVQSMITPSERSTSASAPIPISILNITRQSCCYSRRGRENQHDGNIGLDVKNAAFLSASVVSEDSLVNITVEDSPVLSHHFLKSDESLPEDDRSPSPERGYLPIYEDLEDVSDFELSRLGLRCSGLSPDLLNVLNKMPSLIRPGLCYLPGVDLEAELKRAMESSLPQPEVEPETPSFPATLASDRHESEGEGSETSLAEYFGRTRTSLPSNDGDSAPSHSFHIEKPYSHLGSDFVDVEDYLVEPSASFPEPTYPALDSSATTEDFGFKPTCEYMRGAWARTSYLQSPEDSPATSRTWRDISPSRLQSLSHDLGCESNFRPKLEVLMFLERCQSPQPDPALSFARCRPIPGSCFQRLPSPSLSQSTTASDSTSSLHLRGGGDPGRFSLFRSVGSGKLVGNVERGKKLLNKQVSSCDLVGGWGRNGTWRELCAKMEKRVEKRKELEKIEAEKEVEEGEGGFKGLVAKAKGLVGMGGKER